MPLGPFPDGPGPEDVTQGLRPSIAGPPGDRTRRLRIYAGSA